MKILSNQIPAYRTAGEAWKAGLNLIERFGDQVITEDRKVTKEVRNLVLQVLEPSEGWPILGSGWDLPGLEKYAEQLLSDENNGFDYTYGERLRLYPDTGGIYKMDQIDFLIGRLKDNPTTRRAIAITWVPEWDAIGHHVPCLQLIDFLFRGGKLNLTAYFRSHDIERAYPCNLYGLNKLLEYVAREAGMEPGSITTISASAHIYVE